MVLVLKTVDEAEFTATKTCNKNRREGQKWRTREHPINIAWLGHSDVVIVM